MIYRLKFTCNSFDEYYSYGDADYYFEADSDEEAMELAAAEEKVRNVGRQEDNHITVHPVMPFIPHIQQLMPSIKRKTQESQNTQLEQKWHKFPDEKPDVTGKRSACFIVALEYKTATGKPIRISTPALWGDKYEEHGFSYIPEGKFYWGPDVFENAYAWMKIPEPPEPTNT